MKNIQKRGKKKSTYTLTHIKKYDICRDLYCNSSLLLYQKFRLDFSNTFLYRNKIKYY